MSVVIGEFELVDALAQSAQPAPEAAAGEQNQPALSLTDMAELQRAIVERALRLYAD